MKFQDDGKQLSPNIGDFDAVGVIVSALRSKFGGEALAVARLQSIKAIPESGAQWTAVVSRLSP